MKQTILGIDIGSYSVKVATIERQWKKFQLVDYVEAVLAQSSRLSHEEAVGTALRKLFDTHQLNQELVSLSFPAHLVSYRVIELPFTQVKKIEQTIGFELESHVPLPIDEMIIDYHILSVDKVRSTVLTCYIAREKFVRYFEMLKTVGIDPKYIGVDCIDLSYLSQIVMVPQKSVYAFVDMGHSKTNICVMRGHQLLYMRSIPIGGTHFTHAVQRAFEINREKAEALKIERSQVAVDREKLDQISLCTQKVMDELNVAIRQTYLGFRQIYTKDAWSNIYLCGGASRLKGVDEVLASSLRLNVFRLDGLRFLEHKLNKVSHQDVLQTAVSQGLKPIFQNTGVRINLRQLEFSYRKDFQAISKELKQLTVAFVIVLLLGGAHYYSTKNILQKQIDELRLSLNQQAKKAAPQAIKTTKGKKKRAKRASVDQVIRNISNEVRNRQSQIETFTQAKKGSSPLKILAALSETLPEKNDEFNFTIDIERLEYKGDVVLQGKTDSSAAVDAVAQKLRDSTFFRDIQVTNNTGSDGREDFKIVMFLSEDPSLNE